MIARLFALVVAAVGLLVAGTLNQVGLLDEAAAASIQLLLIPARLVGAFVAVVYALVAGGLFGQPAAEPATGGGTPWGLIVVLVALAVAARWATPRLWRWQRARVAARRKLAAGKTLIQNHLLALADDIRGQDLDISLTDNQVAVGCHRIAIDAYQAATAALDGARSLADLWPALVALHRGRVAVVATTDSLDPQQLPVRSTGPWDGPRLLGPAQPPLAHVPDRGKAASVRRPSSATLAVLQGALEDRLDRR
jgi:hypothetical protein